MGIAGQVALVTGASAGIGEAFARALAARGVARLVLVARRGERLDALAAELSVPCAVYACDVGDPAAVRALVAAEPGVGVLINNAGFGMRGLVVEQDPGRLLEMVDVNCRAVVQLCRAYVPGMVERGEGYVLNVGSIVGFAPVPTSAVYAASKAFVHSFTEALRAEVRGRGVRVHLMAPGPVPTEFYEVSRGRRREKESAAAVSAGEVARLGLAALEGGVARQVPGVLARAGAMLAATAPMAVLRPIIGAVARREQ